MNKTIVMKIAGLALLTIGMVSVMGAVPVGAPEIDGATGINALALLSGALLIIRARKR